MADVYQQLLAVARRLRQAKARKPGTLVRLSQQTLVMICEIAKDVFHNEPFFPEISPPVCVVGDIHGQYYDLLRILEQCGSPPGTTYLFLGDYVDRGPQCIETITLLLVYKILFPTRVCLLRGNHECAIMNELHGFKCECVSRYSPRLWSIFNEVFDEMPIAASVGHRIFACHGGISPEIPNCDFFEQIERPIHTVEGPLFDLMWSDPDPVGSGWNPNPRGKSYTYGLDEVHKFLENLGFEVLLKSHQLVPGGFEFPFEPDRAVVTVFSAPCGGIETTNNGAVMMVNSGYECSFVTIRPMERRLLGARKVLSPLDDILSMKVALSKTLPNRRW
jgi:serine/threonine-protein phosphatase PP1 catalytic subunit